MKKNGMGMAKFDQGPLGHERRKPTTVMTNVTEVVALHGRCGPGDVVGRSGSTEGRIKESPHTGAQASGEDGASAGEPRGDGGDEDQSGEAPGKRGTMEKACGERARTTSTRLPGMYGGCGKSGVEGFGLPTPS